MRILELFGFSSPIDDSINTIKLDGPFIEEDYLIKHKDRHAKLLQDTFYKCNLVISRDLLILSNDKEFSTRDDSRLEVGITHHIHQLELFFRDCKEFEILAIDRFVILNPVDALTIKNYVTNHPLTGEELKRLHLNS